MLEFIGLLIFIGIGLSELDIWRLWRIKFYHFKSIKDSSNSVFGREKMFHSILVLVLVCWTVSGTSSSGWEDLQCEPGHSYLFSDVARTWQEAREECELYGGWLLSINSLQEQNCLVRFAKTSVQDGLFWHDGERSFLDAYSLFVSKVNLWHL